MSFQECIDFAKESRTTYIATVEGDQPRVRPIALYFADERGFYFQTETVKAFYKQMAAHQKIEVCFVPKEGKHMRVSGEVEFVDDPEIRAKALEGKGFLKAAGIDKPEDPRVVIFCISRGEAYFWTMANNMKESEIERIRFGDK